MSQEQAQPLQPTDILTNIPPMSTSPEPTSEYSDILQQLSAQVGGLSGMQIQVLGKMALNMVSGNIQTDVDIAADLGIHRDTVGNYRRNPHFASALALLMRTLAQGTADKALSNLMKLSEKDTKATEIWLRIAKVFDPVEKRLNVNASLTSAGQAGSFQDVIDDFLIKLGAAGYPVENLVKRYHELRAEGAF